jgi:hypothetical protein
MEQDKAIPNEWKPLEEYPYFPTPTFFEELQHAQLYGNHLEEKDYEEGFFLLRKNQPNLIYHRRRDDFNSTTIADHLPKQKKFECITYLAEGRILLNRNGEFGNIEHAMYHDDKSKGKPNTFQTEYLANFAEYMAPLLNDLSGIPTNNPYYQQELLTLHLLVQWKDQFKADQASKAILEELMWSMSHRPGWEEDEKKMRIKEAIRKRNEQRQWEFLKKHMHREV